MAWVKIPADNHPVLLAALPKDRRVLTLKMFGAVCGTVNGNMFAGLFGRSFMVKLSDADQKEALALDGAEPFDPMGTGRAMGNSVFMPEDVFGDDAELKAWVRRAFDYAVTLPPKVKKARAVPRKTTAKKKMPAVTTVTAKKAAAKKTATKRPATKKPATKKPATKKPATKKPATKRTAANRSRQ